MFFTSLFNANMVFFFARRLIGKGSVNLTRVCCHHRSNKESGPEARPDMCDSLDSRQRIQTALACPTTGVRYASLPKYTKYYLLKEKKGTTTRLILALILFSSYFRDSIFFFRSLNETLNFDRRVTKVIYQCSSNYSSCTLYRFKTNRLY